MRPSPPFFNLFPPVRISLGVPCPKIYIFYYYFFLKKRLPSKRWDLRSWRLIFLPIQLTGLIQFLNHPLFLCRFWHCLNMSVELCERRFCAGLCGQLVGLLPVYKGVDGVDDRTLSGPGMALGSAAQTHFVGKVQLLNIFDLKKNTQQMTSKYKGDTPCFL